MKIAIITASSLPVPPVNGGAVENLIDIILKYNETDNNSIIVYSCADKRALEVCNNYKKTKFVYINTKSTIYKLKRNILYIINKLSDKYYGNAFIREIAKKIYNYNEKFDAIIIENRPEYCIPIRKIYSGKIFLHLHNDLLNKDTKYLKNIVKSLDGVFTVSNYINKRVRSIDKNMYIETIYNGIDTCKFNSKIYKNERIELRKKYGFNDNDIVFMFSGRLNKEKGIDKLLEAFIQLPEHLSTKLLIVGSSIYGKTNEDVFLSKLKEIANRRRDDIVFTGYIDYEDIPKIHAISDVALIPSVWDDPSPLTVYEAMSSSLPIITTDSGGIPELVDEECAIVIHRGQDLVNNLTEAMVKLALDKNIRQQMSFYSRQRGVVFSKERYATSFIEKISAKIK